MALVSVQPAGRTVLVVDDEEVVRLLLTRALSEAGYRVVQAINGTDAVNMLEREAEGVDLVVCDLVMPVMNGRDLARWVQAHRPELPVLFISGYPVAYLEAHHLHDPGIPLLRKPFLPSRLLETVEATVGRGDGPRSPSSTSRWRLA
jgi:two-component system cell cycle sensor histidine kinase/response regulator CckA